MNDDDDPKLWVTVLKLVIVATLFIGGTGFALWYFSKQQELSKPGETESTNIVKGWGIVGDSPLRKNR
jgi:hypothetical protein